MSKAGEMLQINLGEMLQINLGEMLQINLGEMLQQSVESGLGIYFLSLWLVHVQRQQGIIVTLLDDND